MEISSVSLNMRAYMRVTASYFYCLMQLSEYSKDLYHLTAGLLLYNKQSYSLKAIGSSLMALVLSVVFGLADFLFHFSCLPVYVPARVCLTNPSGSFLLSCWSCECDVWLFCSSSSSVARLPLLHFIGDLPWL